MISINSSGSKSNNNYKKSKADMVNSNDLTKEQIAELAFSKTELEELALAREMPITFDADCPETTPTRALKFRRVNPPRDRTR